MIDLLLIHGSVVSKNSTVTSDMDIIVVATRENKKKILDAITEFSVETRTPIDILFIPFPQFFMWRNHPTLKQAFKEGILFWKNKEKIDMKSL